MPSPYYIVSAFSSTAHGGNPALIIFHDVSSLSETSLSNIARNFAQPITVFLSPLPSSTPNTLAYSIRYFNEAGGMEVPLCGHGTLAAGKVALLREGDKARQVDSLEFHTATRGVMRVERLREEADGEWLEMQLPASVPVELGGEERTKVELSVTRAFGKEVDIKYVAKGSNGFDLYLLVELAEKEDIAAAKIDPDELRKNGYMVNMITTASTSPGQQFVSRVFIPEYVKGGEDQVCGSAHCVLTPYWSNKLGIQSGKAMKATQVSPRGGKLRVLWDKDAGVVRLGGQLTIFGTGELYL